MHSGAVGSRSTSPPASRRNRRGATATGCACSSGHARSMTCRARIVAVGPFGDVKNYNGRDFYLSWYPVGLVAEGAGLELEAPADPDGPGSRGVHRPRPRRARARHAGDRTGVRRRRVRDRPRGFRLRARQRAPSMIHVRGCTAATATVWSGGERTSRWTPASTPRPRGAPICSPPRSPAECRRKEGRWRLRNQSPLVTALVPTYNGAAFITRTLDSLAAQTWPHIEILIGDDRSTDDTLEVVRRFADRSSEYPHRGTRHQSRVAAQFERPHGPSRAAN